MYSRSRKTIHHDSNEYAIYEVYFITICTVKKICYFGKVVDYKMELSDLGMLVNGIILNINKRVNQPIITSYTIMPNHVHFLTNLSAINQDSANPVRISDVIRDYKSYTTREFCRPHGNTLVPLWQRGYYEHRVRNDEELKMIQKYIDENPQKWQKDKFYVRY